MVDEEAGRLWVVSTLRAVMARRRISYAELATRLTQRGHNENERALRNKVARGTFSAVFFVQCLEAVGLETLKLDMTEVMSLPVGEREFASDVAGAPERPGELEAILASIRELVGSPARDLEEEQRSRVRELIAEAEAEQRGEGDV